MKRVLAALVLVAGAAAAQDNSGLDQLTTRDELRGFEPVGRVDFDGGGFCTVNDPRFFSYRRSPRTGRFASLIWLER